MIESMSGTTRLRSPTRRAGLGLVAHALVQLAVLGLTVCASPAGAASLKIYDVGQADSLCAEPPSAERDRALKRWAKKASLEELLYVLRRPPIELAEVEGPLVERAIERAPESRAWLRRRLIARLILIEPNRARSKWGELTRFAGEFPIHPRASALRITALLPDSGAFEAYGSSVRIGVQVGLEATATERPFPFDLVLHSTGEDDPGQAVAAFDSAAAGSGVMIGPLLSVSTFAVGTASRYTALPIVSPTASDEKVGSVASTVFQIGPSGFERGATLARQVLAGTPSRIGVLISSEAEASSFARGFITTAAGMGQAIAWRHVYAAGSFGFRREVQTLVSQGIDLLFWDGDSREAEGLLRELAGQRVNVPICGSAALAPERHHAQTRLLLEGVRYVGDEWQLPEEVVERIAERDTTGAGASLSARGYLAGRMVGAAVSSGALCPEEITAFLAERLDHHPYPHALGFLNVREFGATLPVMTVGRTR